MEIARNYKSAEEHAEGLEQKFREDEALGMMYPSTLGALKSEFPGQNIMVAALGAIARVLGLFTTELIMCRLITGLCSLTKCNILAHMMSLLSFEKLKIQKKRSSWCRQKSQLRTDV